MILFVHFCWRVLSASWEIYFCTRSTFVSRIYDYTLRLDSYFPLKYTASSCPYATSYFMVERDLLGFIYSLIVELNLELSLLTFRLLLVVVRLAFLEFWNYLTGLEYSSWGEYETPIYFLISFGPVLFCIFDFDETKGGLKGFSFVKLLSSN